MFRDLDTWHPKDFDLRKGGRLEPGRSEYASDEPWNSVPDYLSKRRKISNFLGTDQFLWCLDPTQGPSFRTRKKPIRWRLRVRITRIVAYVDEKRWEDELRKKASRPASGIVFLSPISQTCEYSILVEWPLLLEEIVGRDEFTYYSARFTWNGPVSEDFC